MELVYKSDEEILKVADSIMSNLMEASTGIDHDEFVAELVLVEQNAR